LFKDALLRREANLDDLKKPLRRLIIGDVARWFMAFLILPNAPPVRLAGFCKMRISSLE